MRARNARAHGLRTVVQRDSAVSAKRTSFAYRRVFSTTFAQLMGHVTYLDRREGQLPHHMLGVAVGLGVGGMGVASGPGSAIPATTAPSSASIFTTG